MFLALCPFRPCNFMSAKVFWRTDWLSSQLHRRKFEYSATLRNQRNHAHWEYAVIIQNFLSKYKDKKNIKNLSQKFESLSLWLEEGNYCLFTLDFNSLLETSSTVSFPLWSISSFGMNQQKRLCAPFANTWKPGDRKGSENATL